MRTRPGNPYPLGATCDGSAVNFAIFSESVAGVELCLIDAAGCGLGQQMVKFTVGDTACQTWSGSSW
jgi:glycogen operon protein